MQSCSLDSKCTFLLKTSSDLEGLKDLVHKTLDDVFVRGAVESNAPLVRIQACHRVQPLL